MIDTDLVEKASDITRTDYSDTNNLKEQAESIIEDLLYEIEHLNEVIDDLNYNLQENYQLKPETYVFERDFYE